MVRDTRYLWVGNLPENISEERIREHFTRYGPVQNVKLVSGGNGCEDNGGGLSAAVAFVDICSAAKAYKADHRFEERLLKVTYYEPPLSAISANHYPPPPSSHNDRGHYASGTPPAGHLPHGESRSPRFSASLNEDHNSYDRSSHSFYESRRDDALSYNGPGSGIPGGAAVGSLRRGAFAVERDGDFSSGVRRGRLGVYPSRGHFIPNGRADPAEYRWGINSSAGTGTAGNLSGGTQYRSYHSDTYTEEKLRRSTPSASSPPPPPVGRTPSRPPRVTVTSSKRHLGKANAIRSGSDSVSSRSSRSSSSSSRSSSSSSTTSRSGSLGRSSRSQTRSPRHLASGVPASATILSPSTDNRPLAICAKNLPPRSSDNSLKDGLFHDYKKYGKVTTVRIFGSGADRYAVVCFKKAEDAEKAFEASQDKLFYGFKIQVSRHEGLELDEAEFRAIDDLDEYHPKATRTLFIGGLDKDVTAADLRKHFDPFGDIIEIDIKKQNSSTFAFCQFSDIRSVVEAVKKMDGEHLSGNRIKLGFGKSMPNRCIWIGGVAESVSEAALGEHFAQFGTVTQRWIDRERGHGLVTYESERHASTAVTEMRGCLLAGKRLQIDFASRECQVAFLENMNKQGKFINSAIVDQRGWERRPAGEVEKFDRTARRDSTTPVTSTSFNRSVPATTQRIPSYTSSRSRTSRYDAFEEYTAGTFDEFADNSFERDLHEYAGRQRFENGPSPTASGGATPAHATPPSASNTTPTNTTAAVASAVAPKLRSFSPVRKRDDKSPLSPRALVVSTAAVRDPECLSPLLRVNRSASDLDNFQESSPPALAPRTRRPPSHSPSTPLAASPSREVTVVEDPRRRRATDFKELVVRVSDVRRPADSLPLRLRTNHRPPPLDMSVTINATDGDDELMSSRCETIDPRLVMRREDASSGDERSLEGERPAKKSKYCDASATLLYEKSLKRPLDVFDMRSREHSPSFRKPFDSRVKPTDMKVCLRRDNDPLRSPQGDPRHRKVSLNSTDHLEELPSWRNRDNSRDCRDGREVGYVAPPVVNDNSEFHSDVSPPGTPVRDEREDPTPETLPSCRRFSQHSFVPRDKPFTPISLPLPKFAQQARLHMSPRGTCASPRAVSSNLLRSPTLGVAVNWTPPATDVGDLVEDAPSELADTPVSPGPAAHETNAAETTVVSPVAVDGDLDERIKALDERFEKWTGSSRSFTKGGNFSRPQAVTPVVVSEAKGPNASVVRKKRILDLDELTTQAPSNIMKSLLSKRSVFDEDSERLENISDKYEPRPFSSIPRPLPTCTTIPVPSATPLNSLPGIRRYSTSCASQSPRAVSVPSVPLPRPVLAKPEVPVIVTTASITPTSSTTTAVVLSRRSSSSSASSCTQGVPSTSQAEDKSDATTPLDKDLTKSTSVTDVKANGSKVSTSSNVSIPSNLSTPKVPPSAEEKPLLPLEVPLLPPVAPPKPRQPSTEERHRISRPNETVLQPIPLAIEVPVVVPSPIIEKKVLSEKEAVSNIESLAKTVSNIESLAKKTTQVLKMLKPKETLNNNVIKSEVPQIKIKTEPLLENTELVCRVESPSATLPHKRRLSSTDSESSERRSKMKEITKADIIKSLEPDCKKIKLDPEEEKENKLAKLLREKELERHRNERRDKAKVARKEEAKEEARDKCVAQISKEEVKQEVKMEVKVKKEERPERDRVEFKDKEEKERDKRREKYEERDKINSEAKHHVSKCDRHKEKGLERKSEKTEEKREAKIEVREEKREDKMEERKEAKEERKEAKEERKDDKDEKERREREHEKRRHGEDKSRERENRENRESKDNRENRERDNKDERKEKRDRREKDRSKDKPRYHVSSLDRRDIERDRSRARDREKIRLSHRSKERDRQRHSKQNMKEERSKHSDGKYVEKKERRDTTSSLSSPSEYSSSSGFFDKAKKIQKAKEALLDHYDTEENNVYTHKASQNFKCKETPTEEKELDYNRYDDRKDSSSRKKYDSSTKSEEKKSHSVRKISTSHYKARNCLEDEESDRRIERTERDDLSSEDEMKPKGQPAKRTTHRTASSSSGSRRGRPKNKSILDTESDSMDSESDADKPKKPSYFDVTIYAGNMYDKVKARRVKLDQKREQQGHDIAKLTLESKGNKLHPLRPKRPKKISMLARTSESEDSDAETPKRRSHGRIPTTSEDEDVLADGGSLFGRERTHNHLLFSEESDDFDRNSPTKSPKAVKPKEEKISHMSDISTDEEALEQHPLASESDSEPHLSHKESLKVVESDSEMSETGSRKPPRPALSASRARLKDRDHKVSNVIRGLGKTSHFDKEEESELTLLGEEMRSMKAIMRPEPIEVLSLKTSQVADKHKFAESTSKDKVRKEKRMKAIFGLMSDDSDSNAAPACLPPTTELATDVLSPPSFRKRSESSGASCETTVSTPPPSQCRPPSAPIYDSDIDEDFRPRSPDLQTQEDHEETEFDEPSKSLRLAEPFKPFKEILQEDSITKEDILNPSWQEMREQAVKEVVCEASRGASDSGKGSSSGVSTASSSSGSSAEELLLLEASGATFREEAETKPATKGFLFNADQEVKEPSVRKDKKKKKKHKDKGSSRSHRRSGSKDSRQREKETPAMDDLSCHSYKYSRSDEDMTSAAALLPKKSKSMDCVRSVTPERPCDPALDKVMAANNSPPLDMPLIKPDDSGPDLDESIEGKPSETEEVIPITETKPESDAPNEQLEIAEVAPKEDLVCILPEQEETHSRKPSVDSTSVHISSEVSSPMPVSEESFTELPATTQEENAVENIPEEAPVAKPSRTTISQEETLNAVAGLLACYNDYQEDGSDEEPILHSEPSAHIDDPGEQSDEAQKAAQMLQSEIGSTRELREETWEEPPMPLSAAGDSAADPLNVLSSPDRSPPPTLDASPISKVSTPAMKTPNKTPIKPDSLNTPVLKEATPQFPDSPSSVQSEEPVLQIDEDDQVESLETMVLQEKVANAAASISDRSSVWNTPESDIQDSKSLPAIDEPKAKVEVEGKHETSVPFPANESSECAEDEVQVVNKLAETEDMEYKERKVDHVIENIKSLLDSTELKIKMPTASPVVQSTTDVSDILPKPEMEPVEVETPKPTLQETKPEENDLSMTSDKLDTSKEESCLSELDQSCSLNSSAIELTPKKEEISDCVSERKESTFIETKEVEESKPIVSEFEAEVKEEIEAKSPESVRGFARGRSRGRGRRGNRRTLESSSAPSSEAPMLTRSSINTRTTRRGARGRSARINTEGEEEGDANTETLGQPRRSTRTKRATKHPDMVEHDETTNRRKRGGRGGKGIVHGDDPTQRVLSSDVYDFKDSDDEGDACCLQGVPLTKKGAKKEVKTGVIKSPAKLEEDDSAIRKSRRLREKTTDDDTAASDDNEADMSPQATKVRVKPLKKELTEEEEALALPRKAVRVVMAKPPEGETETERSVIGVNETPVGEVVIQKFEAPLAVPLPPPSVTLAPKAVIIPCSAQKPFPSALPFAASPAVDVSQTHPAKLSLVQPGVKCVGKASPLTCVVTSQVSPAALPPHPPNLTPLLTVTSVPASLSSAPPSTATVSREVSISQPSFSVTSVREGATPLKTVMTVSGGLPPAVYKAFPGKKESSGVSLTHGIHPLNPPPTLVDPVTGHLTPMKMSDEGQYVPVAEQQFALSAAAKEKLALHSNKVLCSVLPSNISVTTVTNANSPAVNAVQNNLTTAAAIYPHVSVNRSPVGIAQLPKGMAVASLPRGSEVSVELVSRARPMPIPNSTPNIRVTTQKSNFSGAAVKTAPVTLTPAGAAAPTGSSLVNSILATQQHHSGSVAGGVVTITTPSKLFMSSGAAVLTTTSVARTMASHGPATIVTQAKGMAQMPAKIQSIPVNKVLSVASTPTSQAAMGTISVSRIPAMAGRFPEGPPSAGPRESPIMKVTRVTPGGALPTPVAVLPVTRTQHETEGPTHIQKHYDVVHGRPPPVRVSHVVPPTPGVSPKPALNHYYGEVHKKNPTPQQAPVVAMERYLASPPLHTPPSTQTPPPTHPPPPAHHHNIQRENRQIFHRGPYLVPNPRGLYGEPIDLKMSENSRDLQEQVVALAAASPPDKEERKRVASVIATPAQHNPVSPHHLPSPHYDRATDSPQITMMYNRRYFDPSLFPNRAGTPSAPVIEGHEALPRSPLPYGTITGLPEVHQPTQPPRVQIPCSQFPSQLSPQIPPQPDNAQYLLQCRNCPVMWEGLLGLKNEQAMVKMHFISGSMDVARGAFSGGSTSHIKISQRMRLGQTQLDGVAKKMESKDEHCILMALPHGATPYDQYQQQMNLDTGFIKYLGEDKKAAGIVNVLVPGTQQSAFVIHIFPPCEFANKNLVRIAPELVSGAQNASRLLVVIATC